MPAIQIEQSTYEMLQKCAVPLEDTYDSIIVRALEALQNQGREKLSRPPVNGPRIFIYSDRNLPNLTHTKITEASLDGKAIPKPNWNSVLDSAILKAIRRGLSAREIQAVGGVKIFDGTKVDEGFSPLTGTEISVQGQDANRACYGALAITRKIGTELRVNFIWRDKEGAAHPGSSGQVSNA